MLIRVIFFLILLSLFTNFILYIVQVRNKMSKTKALKKFLLSFSFIRFIFSEYSCFVVPFPVTNVCILFNFFLYITESFAYPKSHSTEFLFSTFFNFIRRYSQRWSISESLEYHRSWLRPSQNLWWSSVKERRTSVSFLIYSPRMLSRSISNRRIIDTQEDCKL